MNERKARPAGLFIGLAVAIIFLAFAIMLWIRGPHLGWSAEQRIIVELAVLSGFLVSMLLIKYLELVITWVASLGVMMKTRHYDANASKAPSATGTAATAAMTISRHEALRDALRDRHGWRWRYRERWILITGTEQLVNCLSPTLVSTSFALTTEAVLLYVSDKLSATDKDWLSQIRRLRRRRPIDSVVALTSDTESDPTLLAPESLAQRLTRIGRALRWAAPVYLLDLSPLESDAPAPDEAIGLTWAGTRIQTNGIKASLSALAMNLADAGVVRLGIDPAQRSAAAISQHIVRMQGALSARICQTAASQFWRHAVHGMLFAPIDAAAMVPHVAPVRTQHAKLWQLVASHCRKVHGRRVGFSMSSATAWLVTGALFVWILGMNLSGLHNRATIRSAEAALEQSRQASDRTEQMLALNNLGREIDTLEVREQQGAPWSTRFGVNRDGAILNAMWPGYVSAAQAFLMTPVRHALEAKLMHLASLSDAEIADKGNVQADAAHDTLETYLMLANPARAKTAFLKDQLMDTEEPVRPNHSELSPGAWADLRSQTLAFMAAHLGTSRGGVSLTAPVDQSLVASTRQTIVSVRGIQNSTDALYEKILDDARAKYPPVTLTSLLGDTTSHGLFTTSETVPGVFTRAAFEERISRAIDDASARQNVTGDWVLSDTKGNEANASALKAELRQRYFDDYARAWENFLNSLRWQPAPSLTGTVDQLLLLGDPQRSPMVALMNAINYQASAGVTSQSLAAGLLDRAQQLVGHDKDPSKREQTTVVPLASAFGPILRLTGSDLVGAGNGASALHAAGGSDLSLSRYLERVTAMRLKLQQMVSAPDPDAMSRVAAQAVLQGKTSEIADSRDYASRVAASLGGQWAGFGAVLQAPLDQAWQVVVQPAAASLNDIWRDAVVVKWNKAFGGRYPFADSDNDASLPEMARFMRPDSGVIAQFVATQLAGVVERQGDRWVAAQGPNQGGLALNPEFVNGLNRLTWAANVLFPSGDAHVRFDLRGVPTPGITDVRFVLSDRDFHYFNQKEEWMPFEWPGQTLENVTHVEWQTAQGGLRSALDARGRFGLIRLLERAQVEQQDSARYVLTWTPDQAAGTPLRVQMRSEAGAGPLEVLQLRHFALPARIFTAGSMKPATATRAASERAPHTGAQ
ncbi:type VI secretion protein VasK [Pandoraea bronchicola]|uniref:Type VI secretion protein VasK n=1 Tax=Pandoraea bronchicola TaxID=2508287 RepID=A0A5E5BVG7_9BURK|nr:ImcF-related family protein [Pandoraea bronchicola]VVE88363.1 type VI secretion protein VasK [Pandoraea bronchicola]